MFGLVRVAIDLARTGLMVADAVLIELELFLPCERWEPTGDPVRDLVKAGAMIAAEIDRLQRRAG